MKRFLAYLFVAILVFSTDFALASIKAADLKRPASFTEREALELELDITSLYLTSCYVAFAPKLTEKNKIEVEATLIDRSLSHNRARLKGLLRRYFSVYVNLFTKRLKMYAPLVSRNFDYKTDIVFVIDEGETRTSVARWENDSLRWVADDKVEPFPLALSSSDEMNIIEKEMKSVGKPGCKCPSLKD